MRSGCLTHSHDMGWKTDQSANVAALFAILLFPLILVISFAIDANRHASAIRHVQLAADIAALSGARAMQDATLSEDDVKAIMSASFEANRDTGTWGANCKTPAMTVDLDNESVEFDIDCQIPKIFGSAFSSTDSLSLSRSSRSEIALTTIDVALMLDASDSMADNGRLDALKAAAKALISTLLSPESGVRARVALIPYGEGVNAGIYGNRAQGKDDDDDEDADGAKVCVSERYNFTTWATDDPPVFGHYVGNLLSGVCPDAEVTPLTSDVDVLNAAIDGLTAEGYRTMGQIGVAWSWYAISSKWNDIWPDGAKPTHNDAPNTLKVVVIMTDGVSNQSKRPFVGLPEMVAAYDTKTLCSNMQDAGILIYSIGLDIPPYTSLWATEAWLREYGASAVLAHCAGDAARFYEPSSTAELLPMYQDIADNLKIESVALTR